jgi:hypothetical protein
LPPALSDRSLNRLRWLCVLAFLGLFTYYIADTLHWPMTWDTPVMHYIHFLITRGLRPYSDITDMNLPGCYLTEGWGMAVFGWSDLSWRVYEFFLLAVLAASGMVLGGRRNWFAGIFAASFFLVMHGSEGPRVATERDELMAVLLIAAAAFFLVAVRRRAPAWMLACGFLAALAASLKPGAVLMELGLITLLFVYLRRDHQRIAPYVLWIFLGNLAVVALVLQFLLSNHAIRPLLFSVHTVLSSYSKLAQPGSMYMVRHLLPAALLPLLAASLIALSQRKSLSSRLFNLDRAVLFLGIAVGAFSYFMQGKGLTYHRYMAVLFVLLWIGYELSEAMHREHPPSRWTAVAGIALLYLLVAPYYVHLMRRSAALDENGDPLAFTLQHDLNRLGGEQLQHQVLCLDMINGCFGALYRMRLVQNTGATGDMLLFTPHPDFATNYYRNWFMARDHEHPANVVVVENEWFQKQQPDFAKLDAWPQYAAYLASQYTLAVERHFGDSGAPAYRIYLRNGSAALSAEQANPLH